MKSVALIVKNQIPGRSPYFLQTGDDLIRLTLWHSRIIHALLHEHRFADISNQRHWRCPIHPCANLRVSLVTILGPPEVTPIPLRVLEKGTQIGEAITVN